MPGTEPPPPRDCYCVPVQDRETEARTGMPHDSVHCSAGCLGVPVPLLLLFPPQLSHHRAAPGAQLGPFNLQRAFTWGLVSPEPPTGDLVGRLLL